MDPSIGWSEFALKRYRPGKAHSFFRGANEELVELVRANWAGRRPGAGRDDLTQVVLVPCPPERFVCGTVLVDEDSRLIALYRQRRHGEDGYIEIRADGPRTEARVAAVVLYSAATLLENSGERSGETDWEIVSIQAGEREDEPMHPLTMARNMLGKPGGTPCEYSALDFAEAVYYWSRRCGIDPDAPALAIPRPVP